MEPSTDLQDWEFLSDSDPNPNLSINPKSLDHDSEDGAIKSDYFSLNPIKPQQKSEDEVDSENPSWLEPDFDTAVKDIASFCSGESSPRSVVEEGEESAVEERGGEMVKGASLEGLGGGNGNGERVWWKMPLEILKVWVLRARPVWSISIAAAIVGVVMLGRKLYRMKHKGKSIPLKIAIDDKKASQFLAHATRLNEAFSVVKQAPIIRPPLPAGGITSWPVASFR